MTDHQIASLSMLGNWAGVIIMTLAMLTALVVGVFQIWNAIVTSKATNRLEAEKNPHLRIKDITAFYNLEFNAPPIDDIRFNIENTKNITLKRSFLSLLLLDHDMKEIGYIPDFRIDVSQWISTLAFEGITRFHRFHVVLCHRTNDIYDRSEVNNLIYTCNILLSRDSSTNAAKAVFGIESSPSKKIEIENTVKEWFKNNTIKKWYHFNTFYQKNKNSKPLPVYNPFDRHVISVLLCTSPLVISLSSLIFVHREIKPIVMLLGGIIYFIMLITLAIRTSRVKLFY